MLMGVRHPAALHEVLSDVPTNLYVINIPETSQKANQTFKRNVSLTGYESSLHHRIMAGGTAIYAYNTYNTTERSDLNILKDDFESIWIEIIKKNSKSICGCVYRHPCPNLDEFLDYMTNCLTTIARYNKEGFIAEDGAKLIIITIVII